GIKLFNQMRLGMGQLLFFLSHFFRNPKLVGAIAPLSESVAKKMVKYFKNRPKDTPCKILEVGAGTGNITKSIIKLLNDKDILDVIEIDPECCKILVKKFKNNHQVRVHCLSILDWIPEYHYDFIISTLPFNSFSVDFVDQVTRHYKSLSNSESVYTYV